TDAEIRSIAAEVATLRGLVTKRPVDVVRLDDRRFAAAVRERTADEGSPREEAETTGFLLAFNLAPGGGGGGKAPATMQEVLQEQIVGFYDIASKRIFVRDTRAAAADEELMERG